MKIKKFYGEGICFFCRGVKRLENGKIIKTNKGKAFKCKDCLKDDKNYNYNSE